MQAGKLRHRITLEEPSETALGGDAAITYATRATVWAEIEGLTSLNRGGLMAEAEYRVRMRHRADVTPRWRVGLVGTSRKLGILSAIDPTGRRRELVLMAREMI